MRSLARPVTPPAHDEAHTPADAAAHTAAPARLGSGVVRLRTRLGATLAGGCVLLALAGGGALGTAAPAAAATATKPGKTAQGNGLAVTLPAGWTSLSIDDPKIADALAAASKANPQFASLTPKAMKDAGVAFFGLETNGKNPSYVNNVNGQVVVPAPPTLDGAEPELKAALVGQGATVTAQTRITVAGVPAVRSTYKLSVNALSGTKLTVYGTQVVLLKSSKLYIVTVSLSTADPAIANAIIASTKAK